MLNLKKSKENNREEIWKDIAGYEGLYQVSNFGQVKSLARIKTNKLIGEHFVKEKIMKSRLSPSGYLSIGLTKNGKQIGYRVHRLVAQTFISNPENKAEVNHKNGIKIDNRIENLEWNTSSENTIHALKTGLMIPKRGVENNRSICVNQYDLEGNFIKTWSAIKDIKRQLKYDTKAIISCCKHRKHYNTAYGYKWEYAEHLEKDF